MQGFAFERTDLEGIILIKPFTVEDNRGYFTKDYSKKLFSQNGIDLSLKEVFYTSSIRGVVRAIHFQRNKPQEKLVRVVMGSVYDVVVDLRMGSETFGKWKGFYLSEENKNELYIPGGFGHGYLVLEKSIVSYKCGEDFYGEFDDGIIWSDRDLDIQWPLDRVEDIILSEKDLNLQSLNDFKSKYRGLK